MKTELFDLHAAIEDTHWWFVGRDDDALACRQARFAHFRAGVLGIAFLATLVSVTLPTGTDPLPANLVQDILGQRITVCRWQSPDVAWVLCEQLITRYARTPGSHNAGGPGTWTSASVAPPGFTPTGKAKKRPPAPPSLLDSSVWTDIAVNLDPLLPREDVVVVPPGLGFPEEFPVLDLLTGDQYRWRIGRNYVGLAPGGAHVLKVGA